MEPRIPEPRMRDEFRRELRARLMIEAQTALAPRRDNAWTFQRIFRPALGFGLAGLLLVAGAGTAAASSVPGDAAFGLKQVAENVQVALTFDDVARVQLLAQIADHRLSELEAVAGDDQKAPLASQAYADAVARFRAAIDALQQAAPQDKADAAQDVADTAREKHVPILDELQQKVPESAKPAIERAIEEEQKDTPDEAKDPSRTPRPQPSHAPRPSGSARPTERGDDQRTDAPRTSATPTPTSTPRPSSTADRD